MDRPDDVLDFQAHFLYVLPRDGADESLDTDGSIARYAASLQSWFRQRADGRSIRFDTNRGALDVTFFRLADSDVVVAGDVGRIRQALRAAGFNRPNKLYAIYYGGADGNQGLCGAASDMSLVFVSKFATPACGSLDQGLVMLHEILHAMGLVAPCAPHYTPASSGHIGDDRADLLYAGPERQFLNLDAGRDDYYAHGIPGCLDLAKSPFLEPSENEPFGYPGWPNFILPGGIALDAAGNVYVADTLNHRVQKLTGAGRFLASWGTEGSEAGAFNEPRGIAIGARGMVYVADSRNHRIQTFSAQGELLGSWGGLGSGPGKFNQPWGIGADADGNVYVSDQKNYRIQKFGPDGRFVAAWGVKGSAPGQLEEAQGLAIGPGGRVYVADTGNHRIQVFSPDGAFVAAWGAAQGSGPGQFFYPFGVAAGTDGSVYVADTSNRRVQKLSAAGRFVQEWSSSNVTGVKFDGPVALAVGPQGTILVTDGVASRVLLLSQATQQR